MILSERLLRETAREYALRELRGNIISLELAPGSSVSENELAKELGISRTPVREALLELSKWNLVEVYPQRGCVISHIDFDIVEEAVFFRRVMETAVVAEICDSITENEINELTHNIQLQEFYFNRNEPKKILELDDEFHHSLFRMTNKNRIYGLMSGMLSNFDRVRALSLISVKDIKIVSDHKAILNAICTGDKQLAQDFIVKHLSRYKLDQQEIVEKYPNYIKKTFI